MQWVDIRSDTVTVPTEKMRKAMSEAQVGDDVYGEDPTVNELQRLTAEMFDKEAALFTPSGLMSNQLSVMAWTTPGNEIILWENAHIYDTQTSALAILSGVQTRCVASKTGVLTPQQIEPLIRKEEGTLYPRTQLICLENSLSNGRVWPLESLKAVKELADKYSLKIHIDGARVFNASVSVGCEVKQIAKNCDSLSFCLSKGLCCPIGSLIVGPKEMIDRVRKLRKSIGGGMRQAGILAAAGIIALKQMIQPLKEDHTIAKFIARELARVPEYQVDLEAVQANMVFFKCLIPNIKPAVLVKHMEDNLIKINQPFEPNGSYRIACHHYVRHEQAERVLVALCTFIVQHRLG